MLSRMQAKYAGQPVRFLLFPCNQFGGQEPKSNKVIKQFAQQSVSLAGSGVGSNVIMFAKSNVNRVPCTSEGADVCMPASASCCPKNDGVYEYLLNATPPGQIKWNFDKIIVGQDGQPYAGETVLHGPALDQDLSVVIDMLLAEKESDAFSTAEVPWQVVCCVGGLVQMGGILAWMLPKVMARSRPVEPSTEYYLLA